MNKRNAVTFLLEAALQEKTEFKIRVEWGGRNLYNGYVIEKLPKGEVFIRLDPKYFDEEIEIIAVWNKLSLWAENYEGDIERYRQTTLREYFDEEET